LSDVPAVQTTAHRVVWSFILVLVIILLRKEFGVLKASLTARRVGIYVLAGVLLAGNWGTYVWAVASGHVVESSLGYFINPIISVLLGVVFLREKLRKLQWLVVALAFTGVAYITISTGKLPWISLILATTFGFYGLIKKLADLPVMHGLLLETVAIFLPALGILIAANAAGKGAFLHSNPLTNTLLALTGIVTVIPLILFSTAARSVPLSTLGLMQYATPTFQFLQGVYLFKEPFDTSKLVGFVFIWVALIIFSVEGFIHFKKPVTPQDLEQKDLEVTDMM
jgi:chloramphenicol-sensitive protein RarD